MRIFLNELSLAGTVDIAELGAILKELMIAREKSKNLALRLYCSRQSGEIQAIHGERLLTSVSRLPRDEKLLILNWLGRSGPFMDDDRMEADDDLFYLNNIEVTDLGPGEATRQVQKGNDARLLSLKKVDFNFSPLKVVHGLIEEPLAIVDVKNSWNLDEVKEWADSADPEPSNWVELLDISRRRFGRLKIGTHCDEVLSGQTYFPVVSRRAIELFKVLNSVAENIDINGHLTPLGEELVQTYFVGKKSWFSGESEGNMIKFGNAMTFVGPDDSKKKIQCFWHGKIKTPQFRIHFEWPMPVAATRIKITYFGPKISKD